MTRILPTNILIVVGALLAAALTHAPGVHAEKPGADRRLRITLKDRVETTRRLIRLSEIAQIAGGDPLLRQRAGRLDLVQLEEHESTADISRTLVQARLLLSDAAPDGFRVDGAPVVRVVTPTNIAPEDRALAVTQTAIAERLAIAVDDVVVRLAQPIPADVVQGIQQSPVDGLEARIPATPVGGANRVDLWVRDAAGVQRVRPISVEVRFRQLVPVATRPLKARQTLTIDDVDLEPRDLLQRGVGLTLEQVIGNALRRPVVAGDVIHNTDVIAAVATDDPVLIKPRDVVQVTVKKGTLIVKLPTAQALQAGREGEMIRVRNPSSGRVVIGRVTGAGEVEVPL